MEVKQSLEAIPQIKKPTNLVLTELSRPTLAILNEDYPKVKNIETKQEINEFLNFLITILNIKITSEEDQEQLDKQMVLVFDLIKTKFGSLTVPEIKEAFKMYVSKELKNIKVFRLLDCVAVGEVLNAYIDFRAESLRSYSQKKAMSQNQMPEISDSQKEEIIKSGVNRIFQEYQETKSIQENTEYIFDFLIEKGIIKNSNNPKVIEYYQAKLDEAAILVKKDIQLLIASLDELIRKKAIQELKNFSIVQNQKVIIKAKRLVLIEFFDKQIVLNKSVIF
jgi:hypothetical protein